MDAESGRISQGGRGHQFDPKRTANEHQICLCSQKSAFPSTEKLACYFLRPFFAMVHPNFNATSIPADSNPINISPGE
jgi:hypothetical protein